MYVFAHLQPRRRGELGAVTPAKGVLYATDAAYLPGYGPGSGSTASSSAWVPLAVAGVIGAGVLWWMAKSASPVLQDNDGYSPFPVEDLDPEEIRRGTDHEMEHTSSRKVARRIAIQHLVQDPRYYKKLDEVEDVGLGALFSPNPSGLTQVQRGALIGIVEMGEAGYIAPNRWTAASSLIRKGLVTKTPVSPMTPLTEPDIGWRLELGKWTKKSRYIATPAGIELFGHLRRNNFEQDGPGAALDRARDPRYPSTVRRST